MAGATITGTALVPGVSKNKRFYSPEAIGRAVKRAQARIDSGGPALTMRVGHPVDEATAPITDVVGRLTKVWQDDQGRARFEATLADTPQAQAVRSLVDTRNGQPFVSGVSIRGNWVGPQRKVYTAEGLADTADDMELDGLDFTHKPGVPGAGVETVGPGAPVGEARRGRFGITESLVEVHVTKINETTPEQPVDPVDHSAAQKALAGKPLHEYSADELRAYSGAAYGSWLDGAPGSRNRPRA